MANKPVLVKARKGLDYKGAHRPAGHYFRADRADLPRLHRAGLISATAYVAGMPIAEDAPPEARKTTRPIPTIPPVSSTVIPPPVSDGAPTDVAPPQAQTPPDDGGSPELPSKTKRTYRRRDLTAEP